MPIYLYHMVDDGCVADTDCADGEFCNGDEICGAGGDCESGLPPTCPGQVCSEALDQCVDCLSDADCSAGEVCNAGTGQCEPLPAPDPLPIEASDVWRHMSGTVEPPPGWTAIEEDAKIEARFKFRNFRQALDFVQQVGELAEAEFHHPLSITFGWGFAGLVLQTKKIKGLHENDFIMAAKINAIAEAVSQEARG